MAEGNGHGDARKRVFLGMPTYGDVTSGAARTFYRATTGRLAVRREVQEGSLLAANMNKLWVAALNDARHGPGPDYFAMQHGDVQAQDFWLDTLTDELEARDLDVLGVVVPIKDSTGLTSLALDDPSGDSWRPLCRLTMAEVHRLPETFTSADIGHRLLLNTGLWVCRFREDWARQVHFTINDRILLGGDGRYGHQVEPEDWFVSRRFHALGLKVGATRKVAVAHRGPALFGNSQAWGLWLFDRQALGESLIPRDAFPADVPGWLTRAEGEELAALAAGRNVLEIGSYCGRSTICLARHARTVHAVDTFDGRATAMPGDTFPTFQANVTRYGVADRVVALRGTSAEVVPTLPIVFDLAFIDGAHDYESVLADAALALSVLKPGGLLAFHDYKKAEDPGVSRAVDELLAGGADLLRTVDSLAVVRPAVAAAFATVEG